MYQNRFAGNILVGLLRSLSDISHDLLPLNQKGTGPHLTSQLTSNLQLYYQQPGFYSFIVGNKAKWRFSKRRYQENKARQTFGMLCFLVTSVLSFSHLPYYRRYYLLPLLEKKEYFFTRPDFMNYQVLLEVSSLGRNLVEKGSEYHLIQSSKYHF